MGEYAALLICGVISLFLQSLHSAYFYLPKHELRRLASKGKIQSKRLYQVAKHANSAHYFFNFIKFIFASATVIIIARTFDPLTALFFLAVFVLLWRFASSRKINFVTSSAAWMAPYIAYLLNLIEPLTEFFTSLFPKRRHRVTTHIYEVEDLKEFLDEQRRAVNNHIDDNDIQNAINALDFSGKKIKDHMVARKKVRFVTTKEPIGPILLSELHKSGFECFPVQGNSENEVVGMLSIEGLSDYTEGGVIADVMDSTVFYVQQEKELEEVLRAFTKTGRNMFMVVDNDEKLVGLITVRDVLEQILGRSIKSDFEDYNDPKSVSQS